MEEISKQPRKVILIGIFIVVVYILGIVSDVLGVRDGIRGLVSSDPAQETVDTLYQRNPLISYYDFENPDDSWSEIQIRQFGSEMQTASLWPRDNTFPGFCNVSLSDEISLTGEKSLRIVSSVTEEGLFRNEIIRRNDFIGTGLTIYAYTPELTDVATNNLRICVLSGEWICTDPVSLVPGKWTPMTIGLAQKDQNGNVWISKRLTDIQIEWAFRTTQSTSVELYLDAFELYSSSE